MRKLGFKLNQICLKIERKKYNIQSEIRLKTKPKKIIIEKERRTKLNLLILLIKVNYELDCKVHFEFDITDLKYLLL